MALVPRDRLVFMLLAVVVVAIAVQAVTAAGEEWANKSRHRGRAHTAPPAAAPSEPPSTAGLHASHGPAPAPAATPPQGAEAPAPSPAAGEHSDGTTAAVPFAWPAALLAAAGVAAVMVV